MRPYVGGVGYVDYTTPAELADTVLRRRLREAFRVPATAEQLEATLDGLVAAVKAAGWTPGGEA